MLAGIIIAKAEIIRIFKNFSFSNWEHFQRLFLFCQFQLLLEVEHLQDGVNCRPGRLGIVAEALYCRSDDITEVTERTPLKVSPPPNAPSLIQLLFTGVPNPFNVQRVFQ